VEDIQNLSLVGKETKEEGIESKEGKDIAIMEVVSKEDATKLQKDMKKHTESQGKKPLGTKESQLGSQTKRKRD
jgi:hypothetical protein